MAGSHLARGKSAEEFAARALRKQGHRVLLQNARTPHGEIDLVLERGGTFVFVEVKARRHGVRTGPPEGALTPQKLRRVARAAEHLLATRGQAGAPREFLGAAVDLDASGRPEAVRFVPVLEIGR